MRFSQTPQLDGFPDDYVEPDVSEFPIRSDALRSIPAPVRSLSVTVSNQRQPKTLMWYAGRIFLCDLLMVFFLFAGGLELAFVVTALYFAYLVTVAFRSGLVKRAYHHAVNPAHAIVM